MRHRFHHLGQGEVCRKHPPKALQAQVRVANRGDTSAQCENAHRFLHRSQPQPPSCSTATSQASRGSSTCTVSGEEGRRLSQKAAIAPRNAQFPIPSRAASLSVFSPPPSFPSPLPSHPPQHSPRRNRSLHTRGQSRYIYQHECFNRFEPTLVHQIKR